MAFKIRRGQHGDGPEYEPDKPEEPKKKEVGVAEPLEAEPQEKPQGNLGKSESVVANPPKVTHWLYCQIRRCGASYKTEESRHKHERECSEKTKQGSCFHNAGKTNAGTRRWRIFEGVSRQNGSAIR
jgi:hypothetical protein